MKILNASNKKIHLDTVNGWWTWFDYLKEQHTSEEGLNKYFEDWYSGYMLKFSHGLPLDKLKKTGDLNTTVNLIPQGSISMPPQIFQGKT